MEAIIKEIGTPEKKRRGRPKIKQGKRITFYLSYDSIEKLKQMTTLSRNNSGFVQDLIIKEYHKKPS